VLTFQGREDRDLRDFPGILNPTDISLIFPLEKVHVTKDKNPGSFLFEFPRESSIVGTKYLSPCSKKGGGDNLLQYNPLQSEAWGLLPKARSSSYA
jgi:hypothetical protein